MSFHVFLVLFFLVFYYANEHIGAKWIHVTEQDDVLRILELQVAGWRLAVAPAEEVRSRHSGTL